MNRLAGAWNRFWFARFDPFSLGPCRISMGTLWLMVVLFMTPNWERFFGPDGLPGANDPYLAHKQDWFSVFRWGDSYVNLWFWYYFAVVTAVL
ncbi:hypothetical protein NL404_27095, partial [Klebsiella pneumoniae]|nr:hypothetical protein [Klebsiella pneumoniae]